MGKEQESPKSYSLIANITDDQCVFINLIVDHRAEHSSSEMSGQQLARWMVLLREPMRPVSAIAPSAA